jgi:hypothetical protein
VYRADGAAVTYAANEGYDLTINGLRGGQSGLVVRRYRVDDSHDLTLVDQPTQRGSSVHLSASLRAPSVELVVVSAAHGSGR